MLVVTKPVLGVLKKVQKLTQSLYFPVVVACLSLFALGWMDNARSPFFPLFLEATGETSAKGSLFFALASFVAILSSASAGQILSRFGLKKLLLLGGGCMAASPWGLALFPTLKGALITALLFGLSLGWVAVGQNILISLVENKSLRRRLFSLLHCFYALAALTAPLSILEVKKHVPWNFLLLGVTALCLPFLFLTFFLKEDTSAASEQKKIKAPPLTDPWVLLWVMFLSFYIASELILSTRMVVFIEGLGASFEEASHHLFLFFVCMFLTRISFFIFEFSMSALNILRGCLCAALILIFLGYTQSTYFFALLGGTIGPVFPLVMDEMSKMWSERFDVLVARVITLSSLFVVTAHMFVGRLTDVYGIAIAMYSVPILIFLALTIAFAAVFLKPKT